MIRKQSQITALLEASQNDWEEVLYKLLMKYLGLKVNAVAFEKLAEILPYKLLKKQGENIEQKESILLGQAGLLQGKDAYIEKLKKEFKHQKAKYELAPMTGVEWRFSKLRPANFPTIRIAQLSALYHKTPSLFSHLIKNPSAQYINELMDVSASSYWDTHYLPGKESTKRTKTIGQTTKDILLINVVAPLVFTYAALIDNEILKEKAIDLLYSVKPEKNNIINRWKTLGIVAESAAQSQALIELKTNYCNEQKCLDCTIGQQIVFS